MPAESLAPLSLPTAAQTIDEAGRMPIARVWYQFLQGLYSRSQATVPALVATGLVATGNSQGTALKLVSEWNEVVTTALNTGVLLNNFGLGFASIVWNMGANPLSVYPPIGCKIDAGAANAAYALGAGKAQVFSQLTATQFRSLQLG